MARRFQFVAKMSCWALFLFFGLVAWTALSSQLYAREWSSTGGRFTVEAEFVRIDGSKVILKKPDGTLVPVEFEKLSDVDQQYVQTLTDGVIPSGNPRSELVLKGVDPDDNSLVVRTFFDLGNYDSGVALSPDGHYLAVGDNEEIVLADLVSGKRTSKHAKQTALGMVRFMRFTHDGTKLLVGGAKGRLFVFKVALDGHLDELGQIVCAEGREIKAIAISPDNLTAMVVANDSPLLLCQLDTYKVVAPLTRAERFSFNDVEACAFSGDGKSGWAFSRKSLYALNLIAKTSKPRLHGLTITGISKPVFALDGTQLLVCTFDGAVLFDMKSGKPVRSFGNRRADAACFAGGGNKVVVVADGTVEIYETSGQHVATSSDGALSTSLCALNVSDDGRYFAVTGADSFVRVFRVPDGE
jgi:WD40 repeat protein